MKGLSLDQLRAFTDVVELGSFSAAAERAGVSQPAVSQQVRQLERFLGARLIERVGRRAQASPAGAALIIHARRIREEVARALDAVAPHRSGSLGRVRIGTGATALIYLLPPVLGGLKARMPGLDITVEAGNSPDILKRLDANDLDLAVVTLPAPGRAFAVTPVLEEELVAVRPAAEPPPAGPVDPAFLATRPLLLYEGGGHTRRIVDDWFARAGPAPKPVMELGSVEAIKRLVGAGLGWSVLPRLAAGGAGQAAWMPLDPPLSRTLGIVLRRDKHLGHALRAVLAALREGLARET